MLIYWLTANTRQYIVEIEAQDIFYESRPTEKCYTVYSMYEDISVNLQVLVQSLLKLLFQSLLNIRMASPRDSTDDSNRKRFFQA
jgi:hypothetical protein